jgi:hypothetical protein
MKLRFTISDETGKELVGQVFEISGQHDYRQAVLDLWDQLRPAIGAEWQQTPKPANEDFRQGP